MIGLTGVPDKDVFIGKGHDQVSFLHIQNFRERNIGIDIFFPKEWLYYPP